MSYFMKYSLLYVISTLVICLSCDRNNVERYMEIDNSELKNELVFYVDSLDSIHKGEDYVIRVYCRDINDSIKRYTISDEVDYLGWNNCPYNFKCKVKDKDILFVMWNSNPKQSLSVFPIFKLNDKDFAKEANKYFPKIYKKYGLKDYRNPWVIYEPELIHLTFLREKLIGKYKSMGMIGEHVPVRINNKIIYM